jgi:hypothetical protein
LSQIAFEEFSNMHNLTIFGSIVWIRRDIIERLVSSHSSIFLVSSAVGTSGFAGFDLGLVPVICSTLPLPLPPRAIDIDFDHGM